MLLTFASESFSLKLYFFPPDENNVKSLWALDIMLWTFPANLWINPDAAAGAFNI